MTEGRMRIADELLEEWWCWSRMYRPKLGAPRISPGLQYPENRQWDSENDVTDEIIKKATMHAVDWCVNELSVPMQQVIGLEMRNRASGANVWLGGLGVTYSDAIEAVMPFMVKKGLI